jgi:hypothetical protein
LRYSKADPKSRYTNYFIGLQAGHCRRLNQDRLGFLLVVLGNAEQVLVLPMGELLAWMEDVETYARDDWRLNFEQYPNGHILARTRGKAGWDVAHYLNRYDLLSSAKE